jgi:cytosine/uracil/thiamine/allantoin permease
MKEFLKFLLIWISQNLAIPFWMIGHIHLSMNMSIYQDLHIILASLGMNIIVAIGFWVDYKSQKDK